MRQKATQADKSQKAATVEVSSHYKRAPQEPKKEKGYKKPYNKHEGKVYLANPQPAAAEGDSQHKKTYSPKTATSTCKVSCGLCAQLHYVFSCKQFLDMSVQQRKAHVQSASLCSNCLRPGHSTSNCNSSYRCRLCKAEHNTLLHVDCATAPVNTVCATDHTLLHKKEGLLMTSKVKLTGPTGHTTVVTALLDSGAGVSVVSKRVMKTLQLQPLDEWLTLTGTEGPDHSIPRPTAWLTVSSLSTENWDRAIKVTVLPKVTTDMPKHHLQVVKDLPHLRDLSPLADPLFHVPKRVDLLLDVDFLDDILLPEKVTGPKGTPSAWRTTLGWGVMGRYLPDTLSSCNTAVVSVLAAVPEEVSLDKQLQRFWTQEELIFSKQLLSQQEIAIQEHYEATHHYSKAEKRYEVTLPKKDTTLTLGESRSRAEHRFYRNEQSLIRKGHWTPFQEVVKEYLTLGHAQLVTKSEMSIPVSACYCMPMHAVFKQASSSTKLRVVFDASSPSSSGASLNDVLAAGPTLHPNLDQILMRFRSCKVALSGDVAKMYREVSLCPSDRHLHRFLWRPELSGPMGDFCMNRVTFGVTSSPYAAVRTLQQTAADFTTPDSKAHWHIHNSFYVVAGAEDISSAVQLFQDLRKVLLRGVLS